MCYFCVLFCISEFPAALYRRPQLGILENTPDQFLIRLNDLISEHLSIVEAHTPQRQRCKDKHSKTGLDGFASFICATYFGSLLP